MKGKSVLFVFAFIAVLTMAVLPCSSTTTSADVSTGDIRFTPQIDEIELAAGNHASFDIVVSNTLAYDENSTLANDRFVVITLDIGNKCSATVNNPAFTLHGQGTETITITINADRFSPTGDALLTAHITIKDVDGTMTVMSYDRVIDVLITSNLSSGTSFNRILGVFENPLPEPFNTPLATAIISFILWMAIGLVLVLIAVPIIMKYITRADKEEGRLFIKRTKKALLLVVFLWSLSKSLRVFGADEYTVGTVETWFSVIYVILGSLIIWRIYTVFIHHALKSVDREMGIAEEAEGADDLEPLLRLIGKIAILVVALAIVMAAIGFDLAAIITSAGLVTLGISLGAQNVLSQFFSGIVLLATRPFKEGDLVRIGTGTGTYKVRAVTIMTTRFENWDNDEIIIMPNNAVTTASITNITGNGLPYKIHVFMTVAYGEDLEKAKSIMLSVAHAHEGVVNDGTYDAPYCRITSLESSDIEIRLTCFVYDFNNYGVIGGQLRESMYNAFVENNINIPFPQMDIHVDYKNSSGDNSSNDD